MSNNDNATAFQQTEEDDYETTEYEQLNYGGLFPTKIDTLDYSIPCHEIVPNLWLGGFRVAESKSLLEAHSISHIVQVHDDIDKPFPGEYKYKVFFVLDEDKFPLINYFDEAIDFIHDALTNKGTVLVHCMAGVSRSATITAAYCMKKLNMSAKAALAHVQKKRTIVSPNEGFVKQLFQYEAMLK